LIDYIANQQIMQHLLSVYFTNFVHKIQLHIFGIKKLYVKFQVWVTDISALFSRTSKFESLPEAEVTEIFFCNFVLVYTEIFLE